MHCDCAVCNGKDINAEGMLFAEKEIIPFFKINLLNLKYPTHPFPLKYKGLLASLFCYSQALCYNKNHNIEGIFYTENKWLLKFREEMCKKFGQPILHASELKGAHKLVCEFNVEK